MSKKEIKQELDHFRTWVKQRYRQDLDPLFLFHNWAYSAEIESSIKKLVKSEEDLESGEKIALRVAGLSYPLGCVALDPEALGQQLAKQFKNGEGTPEIGEFYVPHSQSLLSAYLEQNEDFRRLFDGHDPVALLANIHEMGENSKAGKILLDAIHGWYGRKRFKRRSEVLSIEFRGILGKNFDPVAFEHTLRKKMMAYGFESSAGTRLYSEKRRINIREQHKSALKTEKVQTRMQTGKDLGRGIDTMYRTAFRNHINLSRIADGKANMMISINT